MAISLGIGNVGFADAMTLSVSNTPSRLSGRRYGTVDLLETAEGEDRVARVGYPALVIGSRMVRAIAKHLDDPLLSSSTLRYLL